MWSEPQVELVSLSAATNAVTRRCEEAATIGRSVLCTGRGHRCRPDLVRRPVPVDARQRSMPTNRSASGPVPGPHNAITDVPGLLVGHVQRLDPPYLTGTTVLHVPGMAVAGVDVRGGAPGTRETDLLDPVNSSPGVNAIVLTGGSAYGLDAATGVMAWLEEQGQGVRVGPGTHDVVPIVPAAVLFDLGRGGGFGARPTAAWGREAIAAATD